MDNILGPIIPHAERLGKVTSTHEHDMKDYLDSLGPTELMAYVQALFSKLQQAAHGVTDMVPEQYMRTLGPLLGFYFDKRYELVQLEEYFGYNIKELTFLQHAMVKHKLFDEDAERKYPGINDVKENLRIVITLMHSFNRAVFCWARCKLVSEELENPTGFNPNKMGEIVGERPVVCRFDEDLKLSDYQLLILHMLDVAYEKGYRKYGDHVCDCVRIQDGDTVLRTHAWKEVMTIEEFVHHSCVKEIDMNMWRCATARSSSAADVARYLTNCIDSELPTLAKDRHVFAFSNGSYVTWVDHEDGSVTDMFVPYKLLQPGDRPLHRSIVACNYFQQPLEYMQDRHWSEIPTPNMDKILDTQEFEPEVKRWLYVFIGRLLYDLGEHDTWQVIPFLKGVGGSGKSTLINDVCGIFYHNQDTGVLSNNCERRFGLSALVGKFMFLGPEIKGDFQLEQAEFQSIVSGESVQINKKHETARSITWTTPGIMGGNELPSWIDNFGSIARRVIIFYFGKLVPPAKGDTELKSKLRGEIGYILQKCARAYIEAVQQVGNDNIWLHLPHYFTKQQDQLRMDTNSLEHFLGSSTCTFGEEEYMPQDEFLQCYNRYCKDNGLKVKPYDKNVFGMSFARYNIRVSDGRDVHIYPRNSGRVVEAVYLFGVDMRSSTSFVAVTGDDDHGGV